MLASYAFQVTVHVVERNCPEYSSCGSGVCCCRTRRQVLERDAAADFPPFELKK
jgi:hypothetical protein